MGLCASNEQKGKKHYPLIPKYPHTVTYIEERNEMILQYQTQSAQIIKVYDIERIENDIQIQNIIKDNEYYIDTNNRLYWIRNVYSNKDSNLLLMLHVAIRLMDYDLEANRSNQFNSKKRYSALRNKSINTRKNSLHKKNSCLNSISPQSKDSNFRVNERYKSTAKERSTMDKIKFHSKSIEEDNGIEEKRNSIDKFQSKQHSINGVHCRKLKQVNIPLLLNKIYYSQKEHTIVLQTTPLPYYTVSLRKLCEFMQNQGIGWQRVQLEYIISNIYGQIEQMHKNMIFGIRQIIIDEIGNIYILPQFQQGEYEALEREDRDYIQRYLNESIIQRYKQKIQLERIVQFKQEYNQININQIYIADYIQSYLYHNKMNQKQLCTVYKSIRNFNQYIRILEEEYSYLIYNHNQFDAFNIAVKIVQTLPSIKQYIKLINQHARNLNEQYMKEGSYEKAVCVLQKAKPYVDDIWLLKALGDAQALNHHYNEAIAAYEQGIKKYGAGQPILCNYIIYLLRYLQWDRATGILREYNRNLSTQLFKLLIARIYIIRGILDDVNRNLYLRNGITILQEINLQNMCIQYACLVYQSKGDIQFYLQNYRTALQLYGKYKSLVIGYKYYSNFIAQAYMNVGNTYFMMKSWKNALDSYDSALKYTLHPISRNIAIGNMALTELKADKQNDSKQTLRFVIKQFDQKDLNAKFLKVYI